MLKILEFNKLLKEKGKVIVVSPGLSSSSGTQSPTPVVDQFFELESLTAEFEVFKGFSLPTKRKLAK